MTQLATNSIVLAQQCLTDALASPAGSLDRANALASAARYITNAQDDQLPENDLRIYAHNVKAQGYEVVWAEQITPEQARYAADWIGQEVGCRVTHTRGTQDTHDGQADTWEFWPAP